MILIVYATTEGQTRKVARFCADELAGMGRGVELLPAAEALAEGTDTRAYDALILAGSVHAGRYQSELVEFAQAHAGRLNAAKTLFISVSLAAAGEDSEDWKGLEDCVSRFTAKTGWTPGRVTHVAGAFRFSEYDFFKSWAMRWIAAQKDQEVDPHKDKEYTDWGALRAELRAWLDS